MFFVSNVLTPEEVDNQKGHRWVENLKLLAVIKLSAPKKLLTSSCNCTLSLATPLLLVIHLNRTIDSVLRLDKR